MKDSFKDHFSGHAKIYAESRPTYPDSLFDYLATLVVQPDQVWDCATGNGQAAQALAKRFARVVATDASAKQIANALPVENVEYRVATAENSGLPDQSVTVVTVAQALHWFHFDAFFAEVDRVLKPGGVLAVWAYELFHMSPAADAVIDKLYSDTLKDYWPPERRHIERGYADIPFPYPLIATPDFFIEVQWSTEQIMGYLNSWSAVRKFIEAEGVNPVEAIAGELRRNTHPLNRVVWPLILKVGRKV